jgi:hypothetical protein
LYAGERDDPPENVDWRNAYGLAVHLALAAVESGLFSHEEAISKALESYGLWLDPEDTAQLREDMRIFERRRPLGVTLVGSEMELRVPLFMHEDRQIYFRCRLDVLKRLISNPSVFIHRDYKSSKWQKTEAEIHSDLQLWAYNWAIHDWFPECQTLIQTYDQLRFGEHNTSKNAEQRAHMKQWLIDMVKLILADTTWRPKLNDWCNYCPIVTICREPRRATRYTRDLLATLAPLTTEGRKIKVEFAGNGNAVEEMIEQELPGMVQTRKHIERVEEELKSVLKRLPQAERERLGWKLTDRRRRHISPEGLRALHQEMGDTFYQIADMSITRLEELVGKPKKGDEPPPELKIARDWMTEDIAGTNVVPAKSGE